MSLSLCIEASKLAAYLMELAIKEQEPTRYHRLVSLTRQANQRADRRFTSWINPGFTQYK